MAAAATLTRLCGPWHTALPTTAQVGSQRSQLLRRRRGDAVREGCDASRRVALAHSRDLRACLQGEDGRNKLEAWGLLRLLVETEEVNEYHFSLVLQDGCDNVEAVRRLDGLIEESGVKPNHVLSTGLHAAWVEHGEFERAVQVLAVARRDGQLRSRVITGISLTTLSRMVQEWPHAGLPERACSLEADITAVTTPWDYLRELYTAGLAQPAHVAAVLRLCTSVDTIDLLLREMRAHGLAPDVHFYTALHNAWLSVGEMADAVHAIEEAREALSHDPASEGLLSRTRSNALRDMLAVEGEQGRQRAWAYFYELQLRGIADIFQYGVMAELGCDSRQELFDLFHRKTLIPHAATYTTLHHVSFGLCLCSGWPECSRLDHPRNALLLLQVWVRLGDMEEAVHQLRQGLVQGVLSRNAVDGLLSATITALSIPCAADGTRSVGAQRERRRERQRQRPKKAEMAWGWRVRPALENDEAPAASVGHTAGSLSVSDPAKDAEAQETPIDRAWEYFTAAQRAARGGGMVRTTCLSNFKHFPLCSLCWVSDNTVTWQSENLLGSSHYKLMAGLCRTADELRCVSPRSFHVLAERLVAFKRSVSIFSMTRRAAKLLWDNRLRCLLPVLTSVLLHRSLQAAYALHIVAGDANARAFSASSHQLKGSYSTDEASLSCHSSHSDSVKGLLGSEQGQ